jgi:hypothetical protein
MKPLYEVRTAPTNSIRIHFNWRSAEYDKPGIWLIANLGQGEPAPATYISSVFTFAERSLVVAIFNLSYVGFELERLVVLGWDSQYDFQKATNCFEIFTTV